MLPKAIEPEKLHITDHPSFSSKNRREPSYKKSKKKKSLSKNLNLDALYALKEILAKQKQEVANRQAISAADPFNKSTVFSLYDSQTNEVSSIDPSAEISKIYNELIDKIVQVQREGLKETTFFLSGDAFASSIFQGAKITIMEYSTAPKIFNIQFSASLDALAFFTPHASDLLESLQSNKFGFSVHRIDTSLQSEDEKHAMRRVTRDLERENEK